jgi:hypothetical protein
VAAGRPPDRPRRGKITPANWAGQSRRSGREALRAPMNLRHRMITPARPYGASLPVFAMPRSSPQATISGRRSSPSDYECVIHPLDAGILLHDDLPPHALYEARRRDDRDIAKRVEHFSSAMTRAGYARHRLSVGARNHRRSCSQTAPFPARISRQSSAPRAHIICHCARHHGVVLANGRLCSDWLPMSEAIRFKPARLPGGAAR